jgi:L-amino acid N-acyltransferase YncA
VWEQRSRIAFRSVGSLRHLDVASRHISGELGKRHPFTKTGFRIVGRRERIGQMDGHWRDTLLLERRSKT